MIFGVSHRQTPKFLSLSSSVHTEVCMYVLFVKSGYDGHDKSHKEGLITATILISN